MRHLLRILIVVAVLDLVAALSVAQVSEVFQRVEQNNAPIVSMFGQHEAVGLDDELFLFGGIHENRTTFWKGGTAFVEFHADTRAFNPRTGLHRRVHTIDGVEPSDRCWFASASDETDRFFIYGGVGTGVVNRDDLWVYSKQENKWTQLSGGNIKSDEDDSVFTENARKIMTLALLRRATGSSGRYEETEDRDTMKFAVNQLSQQATANNDGGAVEDPGALNGPSMVFDERTEELYLFGGIYSDFVTDNSDLYRYDITSGTWSLLEVAPGSPVPRGRALSEMRLRRHNGRRELVMYGGESFYMDIMHYRYTCDLWIFDIDSRIWRQLVDPITEREDGADDQPVCRLHYASVYDPVYDQMHFHGGDYGSCKCTDLITSHTMVYDFPSGRFADDLYGRVSSFIPGFGHLDISGPRIKRAKLTRMKDGSVYMTGGYVAEEPGNVDQRYPAEIFEYRLRNVFTTFLKTPIGDSMFPPMPQEVLCPANDNSYC